MPVPPTTWKQIEANVAARFGTRRRRASGADPYNGADDIVHPSVFVEVRYRSVYPVLRWWDEDVMIPATKEKKFPVLVIVEKRRPQIFAVVPLEPAYLERLAGELRKAQSTPSVNQPVLKEQDSKAMGEKK